MWRSLIALLIVAAAGVRHGKSRHDDMAASLPESEWFDASRYFPYLEAYCASWDQTQCLHLFDLFSASRKMSQAFGKRGFACKAFDIHTNTEQDILSERGFYAAIDMMMMLFGGRYDAAWCSMISKDDIK